MSLRFPRRISPFLLLFALFSCQKASDPIFHPAELRQENKNSDIQFSLLPTSATGISFVPTISDDYRYNFSMDPYIYNGGGVAVIDVNNDDLPDLLFSARLQGCHLYLNKGSMKFEDISASSGIEKQGGLKTGVVVVDINADGWQDLYITRTWLEPVPERRNLLLINNKDNTFSEAAAQYGLDDISASQHANFFDYDKDGDLDCYVINQPVDFKNMNTLDYSAGNARAQAPRNEYESDRLLRNDGGHFTDVTKTAGLLNRAYGLSSIAADFNEDGWTDLFVGNDFVMPDFLYINNKNGSFTDKADVTFRYSANHTMGADFADLNEDGFPDLLSLDMLAEDWSRRQRLMSTMQLERDRRMQQLGYGRQAMRNVLQISQGAPLANGAAEIGNLAGLAATDWSWSPLMADYNNDGFCDVFISSGIKRDMNDLDFFQYTADSINRTGGINAKRFAKFEDFSNLMPSETSHNYLYQNQGNIRLNDISQDAGFTQKGFSTGAAYADLDKDGDLDLITNNLESAPGIYENKTQQGRHWLQIKCKGTLQNPVGIGTKVRVYANNTLVFAQEMNPVRGFYSCSEAIFQVGLGTQNQADKIEIDWLENKHQILTNIKGDQRLVLNIEDASPGLCPKTTSSIATIFTKIPAEKSGLDFVHHESTFEDFDREKILPYRLSRSGPCMASADLNGDGEEDVFLGGAAGQAGALYLTQNGANTYKKSIQSDFDADKAFEDCGAAFLDVDGDKDLDLYVMSGSNEFPGGSPMYQDRLYLNDEGQFHRAAAASIPAKKQAGSGLVAGDINQDGFTDLLIGGACVPGNYPKTSGAFLWLGNGKGGFSDASATLPTELLHDDLIQDLQFADIDGDGKAELLACGHWMPLSVWKWENGKLENKTSALGLQNSSGWWNCLRIADLDGDGDMDIIAGNEGLNTRLYASPGAPLRLFAADFDKNGSMDPLLCIADHGKYRTVLQRDQLASQMPVLKRKFTRNTSFAQAQITDIFPETELLSSMMRSANTLATCWFENQNGQFFQHELPDVAQQAPVESIQCHDFTGDGQPDLLLLGNNTGAEVNTYHQNASSGTLLKNLGKGQFQVQFGHGIWEWGEIRSSALLQGGKLLILGVNDGGLVGYERR